MGALIVSHSADGHVPLVTQHLRDWGVPHYVLNVDELSCGNAHVDFERSNANLALVAQNPGSTHVDLTPFAAVWWRRPYAFDLGSISDPHQRQFAYTQLREYVDGIAQTLDLTGPRRWLNHPSVGLTTGTKMAQLVAARKAGFAVLPTLVSNDPEAIRRFYGEQNQSVVVKALGQPYIASQDSSGFELALSTHKLGLDELPTTETLGGLAVQNQRYVKLQAEYRVTCVGDYIHAARVIHPEGYDVIDIRNVDGISYEAVKLPSTLEDHIHRYMKLAGIEFCAIDLFVDEGGNLYFGEGNYAGQWAWIEKETGLPIGETIAKWLTGTTGKLR